MQIIIFSYNRAAQLDLLIKTIFLNIEIDDFNIAIIYHTKGAHRIGYDKLIAKYKDNSKISFYKREKSKFNIFNYLLTFSSASFIKKSLFFSYPFNRKADNFKKLLEHILTKSQHEFAMFNTDDGYFYKKITLPQEIVNIIREGKSKFSYRYFVGGNIEGIPAYIEMLKSFYKWENYNLNDFNLWTCPFAVDGTVYDRKTILSVIKRVPYHNPITLEENVYLYARKFKLFSQGLSPLISSLIVTKLNRVSTCSNNPTINIDPDTINDYYCRGYSLDLVLPEIINNANVVPLEVNFVMNDNCISIYKIDIYGQNVQNALGPEGTRYFL